MKLLILLFVLIIPTSSHAVTWTLSFDGFPDHRHQGLDELPLDPQTDVKHITWYYWTEADPVKKALEFLISDTNLEYKYEVANGTFEPGVSYKHETTYTFADALGGAESSPSIVTTLVEPLWMGAPLTYTIEMKIIIDATIKGQ